MSADLFFHTHCHSHYSSVDAMTPVPDLVEKAVRHKQPGLALTDHGVLSGNYQLYKECVKHGLKPFPGLEAYLVHNVGDKDAQRYHLTLIAYDTVGVVNLNRLSSWSHLRENYRYKPLIDFGMLDAADLEGIAALTGCYFGWVQQSFVEYPDDPVSAVAMAMRRANKISKWFTVTFVEVQHHDQPGDDEMVRQLTYVSESCGLPMIATQDCHYCDRKDRDLHSLMKTLVYGGDPGDVTFPGDSYHLASTPWVRVHYDKALWAEMQWSYDWLLTHHNIDIPFLDKFQAHLPTVKGDLEQLCRVQLVKRKLSQQYVQRLNLELDVIGGNGMDAYFLLVADYCRWAKKEGIAINCRGSANASLVCWLLGISDLDPIRWDLDFERFMTPDRERPPDIDMDIEDVRRMDMVEYIRSKYAVVQIGNYNRLGYNEEDRGSILVTYLAAMRRRLGPDEYRDQFGDVKYLDDLDPDVSVALKQLGAFTLFRGIGVHAAGFALDTPHHSLADWMPTMLVASSNTTVTQMTMDDVEDAGFVKVDLLGSRTLGVVRRCMELLGHTSWDWIPLNDAPTYAFLRKGWADSGVFQFEGWTSSKGCREMKVRSIEDLTLVNALYRPATRDGGFTRQYLRRRNGTAYSKIHPVVDHHLDRTFGIAVYQEQVLAIMRDIGFSPAERMKLLKAVKMSNSKVARALQDFHNAKLRFYTLCSQQGMTADQATATWGMVEGYSNYGFNRAHAVAYALLGYRTAYLQVNHPLEYMAALLSAWSGTPKEKLYIRHARRIGIRVLPPDVNLSGIEWGIDYRKNALRRPLTSIKGVGAKATVEIEEKRPYTDYADFVKRCDARIVTGGKKPDKPNGVIMKLLLAGALRGLPNVPDPVG